LYLFDDYNANSKDALDLTTFDSITLGNRTVTIFAGDILPTNKTRIRFILPMENAEFQVLLESSQSSYCYDYADDDFNVIADATGKIPDEIEELRQHINVDAYCDTRATYYKQVLVQSLAKLPENLQKEFVAKLEELLRFEVPMVNRTSAGSDAFNNQLFCRSCDGGVFMINKPARMAVLDFFLEHLQRASRPILSIQVCCSI
jgi:hypothetical protein